MLKICYTEIEKLKSKVKSVNRLYKDVTKKFSEVYTVTTKSEQNVIANILSPTIIVENPEFNYSLFRMLFDSTYIDEAVLNDEEFEVVNKWQEARKEKNFELADELRKVITEKGIEL